MRIPPCRCHQNLVSRHRICGGIQAKCWGRSDLDVFHPNTRPSSDHSPGLSNVFMQPKVTRSSRRPRRSQKLRTQSRCSRIPTKALFWTRWPGPSKPRNNTSIEGCNINARYCRIALCKEEKVPTVGENCGHRWLVCLGSSWVTATGSPPDAGTR